MKALVLAVARMHGYVQPFTRLAMRRIQYFFLVHSAHKKDQEIKKLVLALYRKFKEESIQLSGVGSAVLKGPGYAQAFEAGKGLICWEASVGLTLFINGEPAFGLGVDMFGKVLAIRQMQGVPMGGSQTRLGRGLG